VAETRVKARVDIYDGPRKIASHARVPGPIDARVTDPAHRPKRGEGRGKQGPPAEQTALIQAEPRLAEYVRALEKHTGGRRLPLRRLLAMLSDYPREPFLAAVAQAQRYGLFDLERLDRMVLKQIAHEYFVLPLDQNVKAHLS
jgi:hypothetical protein